MWHACIIDKHKTYSLLGRVWMYAYQKWELPEYQVIAVATSLVTRCGKIIMANYLIAPSAREHNESIVE